MTAFVDGVPVERPVRIAADDPMVTRGDGCFEVIKSYRGRLFRLERHMARLGRSASALGIELPPLDDIGSWCTQVAGEYAHDVAVRVLVSPGTPDDGTGASVLVWAYEIAAVPESVRLSVVDAPWHPAGVEWELAGVKTLSYAPNMAAQRIAASRGFDDALLVGRGRELLELPTSSIAWVVDGVLETPALDLGILPSVTREAMLDAARRADVPAVEGVWTIDRLDEASEVMVLSTTKEIVPVVAIDDRRYGPGPLTGRLAVELRSLILQEIGLA